MTAKNQRKEEVMSILEDHCNVLKTISWFSSSGSQLAKTRDVADKAQLDIYTARLVLMKLVDEKRARMSETKVMNSLRWFIAHPAEK